MSRADPQKWEAHGYINGMERIKGLDRQETLVVIHRQDDIVLRGGVGMVSPRKIRVGGGWAVDRHAIAAQRFQCWTDNLRLLGAEQSGLAGVRIQSETGDARRAEAEIFGEKLLSGLDRATNALSGDQCGDGAQRYMRRQ